MQRTGWPDWRALVLAGSFLTVAPGPSAPAESGDLAASIAFFPIVGVVLGALLGALGLALDRVLPGGPVAALILVVATLVTGGLHLDGLMDTADGVFGGRTTERRLEIMRDSRIGAFGAIAGVLSLLAQYACLSELDGVTRLVALIVALGMSRWAMALAISAFRSARASGLGATFQEASGRWPIVVATLVAAIVAALAGIPGVAGFIVAALVVLGGGRFLTARLGGLTGDTYGALAVIVETLIFYVAVALQ